MSRDYYITNQQWDDAQKEISTLRGERDLALDENMRLKKELVDKEKEIKALCEVGIRDVARIVQLEQSCPKCKCPWSFHKPEGCSMADAGGGNCGCHEKP